MFTTFVSKSDGLYAHLLHRHLLVGAINNAGQQCFAMKRLFIHEDVYDAVRDEIVALAKQTKIGDPFAPETVMGPVQNKRVYEKLKCAYD